MTRTKAILISSTILVMALGLLGFAVNRSHTAICEQVDIDIKGDAELRFVDQESLMKFIMDHGHRTSGMLLDEIDVFGIEEDLELIPYIEEAHVFASIDHRLHIDVYQRRPVMRLFFEDGTSSYVDDKGLFMPTARGYSYKCLPVTGVSSSMNGGYVHVDSVPQLAAVWSMAQFIDGHRFWEPQIVQVDLDERGTVLIPRVGDHEIVLGDAAQFEPALEKLKEFYDKGISQTDWNMYKTLDLRYEGQVVGVKR